MEIRKSELTPTTNNGHIKKRAFLENERYVQALHTQPSRRLQTGSPQGGGAHLT